MRERNEIQFDKTEKKIQAAMLSLLKERKFDEIYVKDICNVANINRSTFYNHYHDINALMIRMENSMTDQFQSIFDFSTSHSKDVLKDYFEFIKQNKDFYIAYINSNYDFLISKRLVEDYMNGHYMESKEQNDQRHETIYHQVFFDAGILAITKLWIKTGMQESVEQLVDLVYNEYKNNLHLK